MIEVCSPKSPEVARIALDAAGRENGFIVRAPDGDAIVIRRIGLTTVMGAPGYPLPPFRGSIRPDGLGGSVVVGDVAWPGGWRIALSPWLAVGLGITGVVLGFSLGNPEVAGILILFALAIAAQQAFTRDSMAGRVEVETRNVRRFLQEVLDDAATGPPTA